MCVFSRQELSSQIQTSSWEKKNCAAILWWALVMTAWCPIKLYKHERGGVFFKPYYYLFLEQPESEQQSVQPASVHASGFHHNGQYVPPPESGLPQRQRCLQHWYPITLTYFRHARNPTVLKLYRKRSLFYYQVTDECTNNPTVRLFKCMCSQVIINIARGFD